MIGIRPRRIILALAVLAAGGAVRLPLEESYTKRLRSEGILEQKLDIGLRDQLGQSFFIAVLGGFRSLVASLVEVKTLDAWQKGDFPRVDAAYALCSSLQPQEWHYWDFRAWMSSSNGWDYYKWDERLDRGRSKSILLQNQFDHAIAVLEDARQFLPHDFRVIQGLALLYGDRLRNQHPDPAKSAEYYQIASEMPGAPNFFWRNHVYQLARVPGREIETWGKLLELYNGPDKFNHTPTVDSLLSVLYPKVKALDPTVELPADLVPKADALRREYYKREGTNGTEPVPKVVSPALGIPGQS